MRKSSQGDLQASHWESFIAPLIHTQASLCLYNFLTFVLNLFLAALLLQHTYIQHSIFRVHLHIFLPVDLKVNKALVVSILQE